MIDTATRERWAEDDDQRRRTEADWPSVTPLRCPQCLYRFPPSITVQDTDQATCPQCYHVFQERA